MCMIMKPFSLGLYVILLTFDQIILFIILSRHVCEFANIGITSLYVRLFSMRKCRRAVTYAKSVPRGGQI